MHKKKGYIWTVIALVGIVITSFLPDIIYYKTDFWMNCKLIIAIRKLGFSYTAALHTLKNNFGVLVTAISVIITISINNLNRSENRIFGLRSEQFDFSKRRVVYKHGRRLIFVAPFLMIIAVNFGCCVAGYMVLALSYLFLIIAYFFLVSAFDLEKDLDCIAGRLLAEVPEVVRGPEDIAGYTMILNTMHQWNEKEKYWAETDHLFAKLYSKSKECSVEQKFVLCSFFYETMYVRDNGKDCDRAMYALQNYITSRDREGWDEEDYLALWGMMDCLLGECGRKNAIAFIKWYLDFATRSRNAVKISEQKAIMQGHSIGMKAARKQTGILLIELELYFCSHKKINDYIWKELSRIWNEGKGILGEKEKEFRQLYLRLNALRDKNPKEIEERISYLCTDYQYGNTTKSMLVFYLKYE